MKAIDSRSHTLWKRFLKPRALRPRPPWWRRCTHCLASLMPLWLMLSAVIVGPGCAPETTQARVVMPTNGQPRLNWEFYPPLPRMRLATVPCQLLPKSSIAIHSPLLGVVKVYATSPQTNLPAGFVWAEFEPAIFAAEAGSIEEARRKLDERETLQLELELPKQRLRLERELEEAQRQFKILSLLSTNEALSKAAMNLPGHSGPPLKPEALSKAETELDLLKRSFGYLESTNHTFLGIDLPGQRSEWERRKLEFERRQSQARVKMPFDGQLTITLGLTEGVEEYPVNLSQELAVARDLSVIRVRVNLSNPAWVGLPPDQITAVIRLPNGQELQAPFAFQKIERVQVREESAFYFQFPPEQSAAAARLLGTDVSCELWVALPQPARIVPKLALVLKQPGAFQGRTWLNGVTTAWPGAQLVVEGQTDLAIILPNDPVRL